MRLTKQQQADIREGRLRLQDTREYQRHQDYLAGLPDGAPLDLSWANLSRANLSEANLNWANLSEANLNWANLSRANLNWANLSRANLSGANLSRANLSWTDFSEANLQATGNMRELQNLHCSRGAVNVWYPKDAEPVMQIGCQRHTVREWLMFSDDEIDQMDKDALDWWRQWRSKLVSVFDLGEDTLKDKAVSTALRSLIKLEGRYVTREGRKVRIYATDCGGNFPVHGATLNPSGEEWEAQCWTEEGRCISGALDNYDLVPARRYLTLVEAAERFGSTLRVNAAYVRDARKPGEFTLKQAGKPAPDDAPSHLTCELEGVSERQTSR